MCVCVCACACACVHVCVRVFACVHLHTCVSECVCALACSMYVHVYECINFVQMFNNHIFSFCIPDNEGVLICLPIVDLFDHFLERL